MNPATIARARLWRGRRGSRRPPFGLAAILFAALAAGLPAAARAEGQEEGRIVEEQWAAIFIGGSHAGHYRAVLREIPGERDVLRSQADMRLEMRRLGQTVSIATRARYDEDKETGAILGFLREMDASAMQMDFRGEVEGDRLLLHMPGAEAPQVQTWDETLIGPAAGDRKIVEEGLEAGRTVSFRTYSLDFFKPVQVMVEIHDREAVKVWDRERKLWKATMTQDAVPGMSTTVWLDDAGDTVKTRTSAMGTELTILRAPREVALGQAEAPEIFVEMATISVDRAVPRPRDVDWAQFRLRFDNPKAMDLEFEYERQTVVERGESEILLEVASQEPPRPDASAEPPPERAEDFADYLAPSPYIQSKAPAIRDAARRAAGDAEAPWDKAARMSQWVYDLIEDKDLGVGFASALETLETKRGDCTEHSVLLAALLRSEGLPARIAYGVVYFQDPQTGRSMMGGHVWNEVWLGRWVALDATLPGTRVDAMRIRLGSTALEGPAASAQFLDMMRVLGAAEAEIQEVRYADQD